jgi:hypothetical protein
MWFSFQITNWTKKRKYLILQLCNAKAFREVALPNGYLVQALQVQLDIAMHQQRAKELQ